MNMTMNNITALTDQPDTNLLSNQNFDKDSAPDKKTVLYLVIAFVVLIVVLIIIGVGVAVLIIKKRRKRKEAKKVEKIYGNIDFSFCNEEDLSKQIHSPPAEIHIDGINFEIAESAAQY